MNPIGLLSLLLAAGIIIGIGLALFGFVKREKGKTMRTAGIIMLFACLFGLMYLLANHGQQETKPNNNKHLVQSYQVTELDSIGNVIARTNGLENFPKPLYLGGDSDTLILFNKEAGVLQDLVVKSSSNLVFPCLNKDSWSAFCGTFQLKTSSESQAIYSKKSIIQGSIYLEEIQVQSLKNP